MVKSAKKLVLLASALPFVYGCQGGGGAALLGSLFGGSSSAGLLGGGGAGLGGGGSLALVNPEPTTMLLVGSGVVAMGLLKKNK